MSEHLSQTILAHWKRLTSKEIAAYTAIDSLAIDGQCDAYQPELAQVAGMSTRHFKRAVAELELLGLVEVLRYYDKAQRKTRNTYILTHYSAPKTSEEPMGQHVVPLVTVRLNSMGLHAVPLVTAEQWDNMESHRSAKNGTQWDNMESHQLPSKGGQWDNMESPMNHDDGDDDDSEKKISDLLDFLHEGHRKKLMGHKYVTVTYAAAWREWWDRNDFGDLKNPAGWAASEIGKGHQPPKQMSLPAGILFDDETPEQHDIQADLEKIAEMIRFELGGNGQHLRRIRPLYFEHRDSLDLREIAVMAISGTS